LLASFFSGAKEFYVKMNLIAATVALCFAGAAFAGTPGSNNGQTSKMTGKAAASYSDAVFGDVTCNETQHPKFDTVSCAFASPRLDIAGQAGTVGWYSDFNNSKLSTMTYAVNIDGSGYTGQANY
jgi:hypothetical protein